MASKTRKIRKPETPEGKLSRWLVGAVKGVRLDDVLAAGWQAGMEAYITVGGLNYERFDVAGGYVVVEWDVDGNYGVL